METVWFRLALSLAVFLYSGKGRCVCEPEDCPSAISLSDLYTLRSATEITCISNDGLQDVLSGKLNSNIKYLHNLKRLHLEGGNFGSIPKEIGLLTNLEFLWLPHNELTGTISGEIGKLTKLKSLNLNGNKLQGQLPAEIGDLSLLENMELYNNQLDGTIPTTLARLSRLENLWLNKNRLTGTIPQSLGNLGKLHNLVLADNRLVGKVPALTNSQNMKSLYLLSPGICGLSPMHSAAHTDLPATGSLVSVCATGVPTSTPQPGSPTSKTAVPTGGPGTSGSPTSSPENSPSLCSKTLANIVLVLSCFTYLF